MANLSSDLLMQDISSSITSAASNDIMLLYVIKPLKLAILQYRVKGNTGIANGGIICKIPSGYRPSYGNIDTQGSCWLTSGGTSGVSVAFTGRVAYSGDFYALHPLNQTMYGHSGVAIWRYD